MSGQRHEDHPRKVKGARALPSKSPVGPCGQPTCEVMWPGLGAPCHSQGKVLERHWSKSLGKKVSGDHPASCTITDATALTREKGGWTVLLTTLSRHLVHTLRTGRRGPLHAASTRLPCLKPSTLPTSVRTPASAGSTRHHFTGRPAKPSGSGLPQLWPRPLLPPHGHTAEAGSGPPCAGGCL